MKTLTLTLACLLGFGSLASGPNTQQNTAKTDLPGAGPCTNFPVRYQRLEERMAWFYGCMHENPPTLEAVRAKIAALSPEKRAALKNNDLITQEALIGIANYDLPIQVFPK